jgi:hypothetical protein
MAPNRRGMGLNTCFRRYHQVSFVAVGTNFTWHLFFPVPVLQYHRQRVESVSISGDFRIGNLTKP